MSLNFFMSARECADLAHRLRCLVAQGNRKCICDEYAAVTACMHPDCPEHGYETDPVVVQKMAERLAKPMETEDDL